MAALVRFELQKVWSKRNFQSLMLLLIFLNVFFLWYLNRPAEDEPALSAYRAVCQDISPMTEKEKLAYISDLKEQADALAVVEQIQSLNGQGKESAEALAKQLENSHPGILEEYGALHRTGGYLVYTDSLAKERILLDALYEEISAVSAYIDYLQSVEENSRQLQSVSVFQADAAEPSFASRNIAKSAADHQGLTAEDLRWYPSKGISMALESQTTDLLLLLSLFLFVGQLITEDKGKGMFVITRAARRGMGADIGARILAVLVHCAVICLLLYSSNLLYAWGAAGLGDLSAALQSISSYMESSLSISLGAFLLAAILTKICAAFFFGLFLAAIGVYSSWAFMPQLWGIGFLGTNWLLYLGIPSYSSMNLLKYLSYFGLLQTDELYGTYLNLNVWGFPFPRMNCALVLLAVLILFIVILICFLFCRGNRLVFLQRTGGLSIPFQPHSSLFCHEGYKIFIASRSLLLLLTFVLLLGVSDLGRSYTPSSGEQYYQSLMLSLEGELTEEKEACIAAEQVRYDEAFAQIERIDEMVAQGKISEDAGDNLKEPWYSQTAFYSWFQRIQTQYRHILSDGGVFIYDTGYLYLLGQMDDSFLIDLLLLSLCFSFAFSNVMAMEDDKGLWNLLASTKAGKKNVIARKWHVCALTCAGSALLPWIFRFLAISAVYPLGEMAADIQNIPQYQDFPLTFSVAALIALAIFSQILAAQFLCAAVLLLSKWRKNYFQALFLGLLLLAAPLILAQMGLDVMKYFSLWPLYSWTGILG